MNVDPENDPSYDWAMDWPVHTEATLEEHEDAHRHVMPRKRPSKRVLLGSPAFDQRIKQLATSWKCSVAIAEDRFFGFRIDRLGRRIDLSHQRPNHDFPVRRTRQFEE